MSVSIICLWSPLTCKYVSPLQVKYCILFNLYVLRPVFVARVRENCFPPKPRGRFLIIPRHVTTCNGMHADRLPSADPWCFRGWLRWKQNREVLKSCANSRQFDWLSITRRGKVLAAYLQGQSSPTGRTHGPDKSPDFFFSYGWRWGRHVTAALALKDCSAAAGCLGTWRAATFLPCSWKHSKRHHYHCLHAQLGSATGPVPVSVTWMREI